MNATYIKDDDCQTCMDMYPDQVGKGCKHCLELRTETVEVLDFVKSLFGANAKIFPDQTELIITHHLCAVSHADSGRLFYLGMDPCDAVYFCKGWENAKGCQVEHYICELYGIQRIEA